MNEELKQEFYDSFSDIYEDVEHCLNEIRQNPEPELLNRLFRSIHNAKGNAGMVMLENIVAFTHAIEELAGALRAGRFPCTVAISEIIQIVMDRLKDLHQREIHGKAFENLRETETIRCLEELARCDADSVNDIAARVLTFLGDGNSPPAEKAPEIRDNVLKITLDDDKLQTDLLFFQEIALQLDSLAPFREGRSMLLFEWGMKVNRIGGNILPSDQFAAAIYMHDIGMSWLPRELIENEGSYREENHQKLLQGHPRWGYELLRRIPGWEEAALMVLDHQEHVNGKGYPNRKKGDEIHPGAKIIAILDVFYSITQGRVDRDNRNTVVRAISEINSHIDTRFDSIWVQCFNAMIRQELQSGML